MNILNNATKLDVDSNKDIRYILFIIYLKVSFFLGIIFASINILNKRPTSNIIIPIFISIIIIFIYFKAKNNKNYFIARMIFMVFTISIIPILYITSPGSYSAILYVLILIVFILSFIAIKPFEYLFPIIAIIESIIMIRTELLYPELYYHYTDEIYRINDISSNYVIVSLSIVLTIYFIMKSYAAHTDKLYSIGITDSLTGLYNRRYFFNFAEMEFNRSQRNNSVFSIIFIDLNNFKSINDVYGHLKGDEILKDIANIIMTNIRNYDIATRYGGDEFIIILPNTDKEKSKSHVNRLKSEFDDYSKEFKSVNFSVGFGFAESKGLELKEVIEMADKHLYENKKNTKNKEGNISI